MPSERRLLEGEFRPGGTHREWTDANVLRMIRRRSLAKLRHEVEPVDQAVLGRLTTTWQGVVKRRHGADALLDAIDQLQGAPLPASILETEILPARIDVYDPADLDAVTAAGEVVWVGVEPLGEHDGRVALYLADHMPLLLPPNVSQEANADDERARMILEFLRTRGASFFGPLHDASGGGYPAETVNALWNLAWQGLVTNDTFHALRAFTRSPSRRRKHKAVNAPAFRSRRLAPPSAEGRWSIVSRAAAARPAADTARTGPVNAGRPFKRGEKDATKWAAAVAQQLLARHGVLTREAVGSEATPGGFGVVYPVLKAMEESGRLRRGYFVAGLGATQFALPGALDLLRSLRDRPDEPEIAVLAATDPANPYGATLRWPRKESAADASRGPTRSVGATVILVDGALVAYLARGDRQLTTYLPEAEPVRARASKAIAHVLIDRARTGIDGPRGMLLEEIDGMQPSLHPIAPQLTAAGFVVGALGMQPKIGSHQSSVFSRQSPVIRRQSKSTVSSPFGRRFFDSAREPSTSGEPDEN